MKTLKFKKILLIAVLLSAGLVAGCGEGKDERVNGYFGYAKKCIRGVVYYERLYMLAPAYKQDGTLYLCESN